MDYKRLLIKYMYHTNEEIGPLIGYEYSGEEEEIIESLGKTIEQDSDIQELKYQVSELTSTLKCREIRLEEEGIDYLGAKNFEPKFTIVSKEVGKEKLEELFKDFEKYQINGEADFINVPLEELKAKYLGED